MRSTVKVRVLAAVWAVMLGATGSARAVDHTVTANSNLTYTPNVVNAQVGDRIIFVGTLSFHPTRSGSPCTADGRFAFTSGTQGIYTIPAGAPAQIPYFCSNHCSSGMTGVINISAPPPVGTCCVGTACSVQTEAACGLAAGSWNAAQAACAGGPGNPVTCCPANFNQAGGVSVQDIYDFLTDWNAQAGMMGHGMSADINGDHAVTVQDVYDFLALWSAGC